MSQAVEFPDRLLGALVDTHAHLHWDSVINEIDDILWRARSVGVQRILTLGTDVISSRVSVQLSSQHDGVYAAVGIHPTDISASFGQAFRQIEELTHEPKVKAIGETGLDYYHADSPPRAVQLTAFEDHLRLAATCGKPICVHNREATDDVMRLVARYSQSTTVVLHCFTGNQETAQEALEMGCYISFAGNSTYPKLRDLLTVAASVPPERLLLETDTPFLAPIPFRSRRNEPSFIVHTYDVIAEAHGLSRGALSEIVTRNAGQIFGWCSEVVA